MAELGYSVTPEVLQDNIARLACTATDRVWIAEKQDRLVGLVSVHLTPLFHTSGHLGRITSLVVLAPERGHGVAHC